MMCDVVVDRDAFADDVARSLQLEYQMVAVWAELDLGVPLRPAKEEHFNYFMIPQLIGGSDWSIRSLSNRVRGTAGGIRRTESL